MFKKELEELLDNREQVLRLILAQEYILTKTNETIIDQELIIKIELEKEISSADQAEIKTKYSNAEKRRLELEKRLNSDNTLSIEKARKTATEIKLLELNGKDKIYRIKERFLFKQIDIYLAELNLKIDKD